MKLYECIIEDGENVFKRYAVANDEKQLKEIYGGNVDFVRIKDITKKYFPVGVSKVLCDIFDSLFEENMKTYNKSSGVVEMKKYYMLETTFIGASGKSIFYYDSMEKLLNNITTNNYSIYSVEIEYKVPYGDDMIECEPNYFDGCTLNDLCQGDFEYIKITNKKRL